MSLDLSDWARPDRGALFVVTGASGTGKTTLVREALGKIPELGWSVSMTTRAPRAGEQHGRDYYFVDRGDFEEAVDQGRLLEWAEVYGNRYGTPRGPVEQPAPSTTWSSTAPWRARTTSSRRSWSPSCGGEAAILAWCHNSRDDVTLTRRARC